jgi:hypothetical protein
MATETTPRSRVWATMPQTWCAWCSSGDEEPRCSLLVVVVLVLVEEEEEVVVVLRVSRGLVCTRRHMAVW